MVNTATIEEFLQQDHLAFVGLSRNPKDFSHAVYRGLRDQGRTLYPVNASVDDGELLEGKAAYASLHEVPDPVDGVVVMVPAAQAEAVVLDAISRGIPRVWLYRGVGRGSVSTEAVLRCRDHGVAVVDGACPLMFDGDVRGIHRLHRRLAGRSFDRGAS